MYVRAFPSDRCVPLLLKWLLHPYVYVKCVCSSAQYGSSFFFLVATLWRLSWQVLPMHTDFPINPSFAL